MADLSPWDYERIVIGSVLTWQDAAKYVLPDLTHNMFLYSTTGQLTGSKDYMRIWQAITEVHLIDKVPVTLPMVTKRVGENGKGQEIRDHLVSLVEALQGFYREREFNPQRLMIYAECVRKAGTMYQQASRSYTIAKILESPETFAKAVAAVVDVNDWAHNNITQLSSTVSAGTKEGYQHISSSVERAALLADRIYSGEQISLLPVGMPSVHLPFGKLVVMLAESNAGKSTIASQWALGAAIGLRRYGIKGAICINSLEEDDEDLTLKMAAMLAEVDLFEFKFGQGITSAAKYRLDRALEYIDSLPLYIDNTNMLKSSSMQLRAEGIHTSEFGPLWHVQVDYLELLAQSDGDEIKEQRIDKAIHKCFEISRTTGANVLVLSQVTLGGLGTNPKFRIAGPDGARYSKAVRHAADILYEFINYPELKNAGIEPSCPDGMNTDQPWMLCSKYRNGRKFSPIPYGWQPEYQRSFDTLLNKDGDREITLFSHPLPCFEEIESGGF